MSVRIGYILSIGRGGVTWGIYTWQGQGGHLGRQISSCVSKDRIYIIRQTDRGGGEVTGGIYIIYW